MASMPDVAFEDGHAIFHVQDCIRKDSITTQRVAAVMHHVRVLPTLVTASIDVIAAAHRALGTRVRLKEDCDAARMRRVLGTHKTLHHGEIQ